MGCGAAWLDAGIPLRPAPPHILLSKWWWDGDEMDGHMSVRALKRRHDQSMAAHGPPVGTDYIIVPLCNCGHDDADGSHRQAEPPSACAALVGAARGQVSGLGYGNPRLHDPDRLPPSFSLAFRWGRSVPAWAWPAPLGSLLLLLGCIE